MQTPPDTYNPLPAELPAGMKSYVILFNDVVNCQQSVMMTVARSQEEAAAAILKIFIQPPTGEEEVTQEFMIAKGKEMMEVADRIDVQMVFEGRLNSDNLLNGPAVLSDLLLDMYEKVSAGALDLGGQNGDGGSSSAAAEPADAAA